jgi:hypothetical protein
MVVLIGTKIYLNRRPTIENEKPRLERKKKKKSKVEEFNLEEFLKIVKGRETFIYEPRARRDPFNPLIKKEATAAIKERERGPGIKLTGILWDPEDPLAEIEISGMGGKRIVHKGDLIKEGKVIPKSRASGVKGGTKILDIKKDKIILQEEGGKKTPVMLEKR